MNTLVVVRGISNEGKRVEYANFLARNILKHLQDPSAIYSPRCNSPTMVRQEDLDAGFTAYELKSSLSLAIPRHECEELVAPNESNGKKLPSVMGGLDLLINRGEQGKDSKLILVAPATISDTYPTHLWTKVLGRTNKISSLKEGQAVVINYALIPERIIGDLVHGSCSIIG